MGSEVLTLYLFFASIHSNKQRSHQIVRRRGAHLIASARKVAVHEFMSLDRVADENVAGFFTEVDDNADDDQVDGAGARRDRTLLVDGLPHSRLARHR
jgi:hypothetical protein